MDRSPTRPAERRNNDPVLAASVAYAALLTGAEYAVKSLAPRAAVRFILALLPALAIVAILIAVGRFLVEESDEYLPAGFIRQIPWAIGAMLSLATTYGFHEVFDVAPTMPLYVVAILWFFCLGVAGAALRIRVS
ncbi:hypothetical protein KX816_20175 [Sphingosinicellaceae bacterium]|nr:hypothetical protein KX816_20175 [Sphingosinicellaceae bacterium]